MKRNKRLKRQLQIYSLLTILLIMIAIFAKELAPYDPNMSDLSNSLQQPTLQHLFGTDIHGRDIFSRIIVGSSTTIFSSLLLVFIICLFGTTVGVICGYFGGIVDTLIMRISDIFLAFPSLVFALAIAAILNQGIVSAIMALAIVSWPKYARLARSQTLSLKSLDFIKAAIMAGNTPIKIICNHILPNILGPIIVTASLDIGTMMMELAALSFLGLGATSPSIEWGSMMSNGRSMIQTYPWVVLSPGVAILVTVIIFNLLGDTLRDYFDIRNKI